MTKNKTNGIIIIAVSLAVLIGCVIFIITLLNGNKGSKGGSKPEEKVEKLTPFDGDIDGEEPEKDLKKILSTIEQFSDYGSPQESTVVNSEEESKSNASGTSGTGSGGSQGSSSGDSSNTVNSVSPSP